MSDIIEARRALLQAQDNCPCCGSRVTIHAVSGHHFLTHFRCGAIFDVLDSRPMTFLKSCPAPSAVAVEQLNRLAVFLAEGGQEREAMNSGKGEGNEHALSF